MGVLEKFHLFVDGLGLPLLLIVGIIALVGLYFGKLTKFVKLPSIIGYMIIGVLLGPSLIDLLSEDTQTSLSFITEIALGFVALTIGLELSFKSLKEQGGTIITIIFSESFCAFLLTFLIVYIFCLISPVDDMLALPIGLIFGALAPASAPAGTVAVIKEYNAKGPLTKALYAVVGFDDGLGIIIFGFAFAIAKSVILSHAGIKTPMLQMFLSPLIEVGLSILIGVLIGFLFGFLIKFAKSKKDIFIVVFAAVMISVGLCKIFNLSFILTNMIVGIVIVNFLDHMKVHTIGEELSNVMPLIFILFFVMAGANLHIMMLPSLGLLGVFYIIGRASGLMGGAWFGAIIGRSKNKVINRYLGLGILSQAGVAIGLALVVKKELAGIGNGVGDTIGNMVITTVTATCIFFEIIGPILTKIGLRKAGEISTAHHQHNQ